MKKILIAFAILSIAISAHADPAPYNARTIEQQPYHLVLAWVSWHEAGNNPYDLAAIHDVLQSGAERENVSPQRFAYLYSRRFFTGRAPRSWILGLGLPGAAAPPGWPGNMSWARWEPRWLEHLERSLAITLGQIMSECEETPDDWGSPTTDHDRAVRMGLVLVACGDTRNEYWSRPWLSADRD